ncbi:MAG TPA: SpoIID/LytB domain-containing protein [Bryobacteraceae bacterium]|nr:SpoIID/LytB domain-containing protein [Bryobacteraceae bacterium]
MLLLEVAILTLLHPRQVTVNGTEFTLAGEWVQSAGVSKERWSVAGPVDVQAAGLRRRYRGNLEITAKGRELALILQIPEEELVAAAVSAESPPGAPGAALQAQAIIARSWLRASRKRHGNYDFCDTTHCQHFKEPSPAGFEAAAKTRGLTLVWQDRPFAPAYSASCGGRTKTAAEIDWNDDNTYPYFAVDCLICRQNEPAWSRRPAPQDLALILQRPNREATRLTVGRRSGWAALPSNSYVVSGPEITGRGHGHGLGYCQRGGAGMARQGAGPAAILRHYFPGTAIINSR